MLSGHFPWLKITTCITNLHFSQQSSTFLNILAIPNRHAFCSGSIPFLKFIISRLLFKFFVTKPRACNNNVNYYSGHLWWDRVKVYRRICSLFFFHVELLQLVARARNIFRSDLSAIEFFLSTWCGRLSWKSFLLPKIKYIELFGR